MLSIYKHKINTVACILSNSLVRWVRKGAENRFKGDLDKRGNIPYGFSKCKHFLSEFPLFCLFVCSLEGQDSIHFCRTTKRILCKCITRLFPFHLNSILCTQNPKWIPGNTGESSGSRASIARWLFKLLYVSASCSFPTDSYPASSFTPGCCF